MRRFGVWALVAAGVFVVGCGDDEGAGASGGGGGDAGGQGGAGGEGGEGPWAATAEQLAACGDHLTAICGQLEACRPAGFVAFDGTIEACVAARMDACTAAFLPGANVGAEDLAACADVVDALDCSGFHRFSSGQRALEGCPRIPGSIENGGVCHSGAQCASTFCSRAFADECGSCADLPTIGKPCSESGQCAEGLACANGTCAQPADVGDGCSAAAPCFVDLHCADGLCAEPLAAEAECSPQVPNACGLEGFCNRLTSVCGPVGNVGEDAACAGLEDGSLALCAYGQACRITSTATFTGQCEELVAEGESCGGNFVGPPCAINQQCVGGVCMAAPPLEEAAACE